MRRIYIEETSAVRSELLDRDLRRCGALRDRLSVDRLGFFHVVAILVRYYISGRILLVDLSDKRVGQSCRIVGFKVLNDALRYEQNGKHCRHRQQYVERSTYKIYPEITKLVGLVPCYSSDKYDCLGHPEGGR